MSELLVNFSVLMEKPTGISVYAKSLLPSLEPLNPILFAKNATSGFTSQPIPAGLSPEFGIKGHLRRLWWIQCELSRRYHSATNGLIFSPLPEAPLYSGCRYIVTAHDVIPLRFPQQFPPHLVSYFRHYVGRVMGQAEHILCNSSSTAQDIAHFYQVPAHKLTPIALAYDEQTFRPSSGCVGNYFLYLGRQDTHKNLPRLITAFAQVAQRYSDIELWLAGPKDSRYTPALIAQIQEFGLSQRIRFLDYVPYGQLPELIGGAIALTFPSLWEGFGLPVLEAMACGTPVITSNLSSLPEIVGNAGILIDPYNTNEIAEAIETLARNSQLRQQLSAAGLARAQDFSWAKTGQRTAEVLQRFM